MAWIEQNSVIREIGRITSENHEADDITQAITDATATAEGLLRVVVNDTELQSWDTEGVCPTDIVIQVSRVAAAMILSRFYGQSLGTVNGQPSSRAADLNRLALKELEKYSKGQKRLVSLSTDDQIATASLMSRSGTNTTRKFDVGTDSSAKKMDRF